MTGGPRPGDPRVRVVASEPGVLAAAQPASLLSALTALAPQTVLAQSRTTETSVVALPGHGLVVRKRWWFPEPGDRVRGALRTTFLAPSPAARAYAAMTGGGPTGFHPRALAALEARRGGLLHECLLLLTFVPEARDLAVFLRDESRRGVRRAVLADLAGRVAAIHDRGVIDGELHPRNVLVADGRTWKVDCARQRRFRAGAPARRRAHDLACLDVGLARLASPAERVRALRTYVRATTEEQRVRPLATRVEFLRRRLAPREERRLPAGQP